MNNIILDFKQSSIFQRADLKKRLQAHFPHKFQATKSTAVIIKFNMQKITEEILTINELLAKQPSIGEDKIALLEEYKTTLLYLIYEELQKNNNYISAKLNTLPKHEKSQNLIFEYITAAGITVFNFFGYFFAAVVLLYNWLPWLAGLFCMHIALAPAVIIIGAAATALLGIHFFIPAIKKFFGIGLFPSRQESFEKQFLIIEKINTLLLANSNIDAQTYLYLTTIANPINKHIRALKEKPLENKRPISAIIKSALMITINCFIASSSAYNLLLLLKTDITATLLLSLATTAHLPLLLCILALPSFFMITFNIVRFLSNATIFNAEDRTNQDYLLLRKRVDECTVVPEYQELSKIYREKYGIKSARQKKSSDRGSEIKHRNFQNQNHHQQVIYQSDSNGDFGLFKKCLPRNPTVSDPTIGRNHVQPARHCRLTRSM